MCEACGAPCAADLCAVCDAEVFDNWQRQIDSDLVATESIASALRTLAPDEADITF